MEQSNSIHSTKHHARVSDCSNVHKTLPWAGVPLMSPCCESLLDHSLVCICLPCRSCILGLWDSRCVRCGVRCPLALVHLAEAKRAGSYVEGPRQ